MLELKRVKSNPQHETPETLAELHVLVKRMKKELELKDRVTNLVVYRNTFTGQDLFEYLLAANLAKSPEDTYELAIRMLRVGYIKNISKEDPVITNMHAPVTLESIFIFGFEIVEDSSKESTSSKMITKLGKAAGLTFKHAMPKLTSNSTSSFSQNDSTGKTKPQEYLPVLISALAQANDVQMANKDQLLLMRLDLQQHTALLEHVLGRLDRQSTDARLTRFTQLASLAVLSTLPIIFGGWLGLALVVIIVLGFCAALYIWPQLRQEAGLVAAPTTPAQAQQNGVSRDPETPSVQMSAKPRQESSRRLSRSFSMTMEDDASVAPDEGDFFDWPDAPLLMRPNSIAPKQVFNGMMGPNNRLRLNAEAIPFETDLFKGRILVYIRHLNTTPREVFKGKHRCSWVVIQGKFKRKVALDSILVGQQFRHALSHLPALWFIKNILLPIAQKISPNMQIGNIDAPFLLVPLIMASQVISVAAEGSEPNMMNPIEDLRIFNPELTKNGGPASVSSRRKFYQNVKVRQNAFYDTQNVWTFHIWQEYLDYASYTLNLPYASYDLMHHLAGQPLQIMAVDPSTSEYMVNLEIWHQKLMRGKSV